MKTTIKQIAYIAIIISICFSFGKAYALETNCNDRIDNDADGLIDMFDSDCSPKSLGITCSGRFYLTRQITSPSNATRLSSINFVAGDINIGDNITYSNLLLNGSFYYDGFLYSFAHTPASNILYQLRNNGTTASMTIDGLPSSSWNNAVCSDSGMLYLLENSLHKLWKVNLKTLAVTSVNLTGISDSPSIAVWGDLVIDPTNQDLYCWYHPTSSSSVKGLYKINLKTNTFIFMGTNTTNTMGSLFFNAAGNLYGYGSATIGGNQDRFYTINKNTGATIQFGTPDIQVTQTDACNCAAMTSILPVELIDFTGRLQENMTVGLSWKTASETNNDYFNVRRSSDAVEWESIGKVNGNGNTKTVMNYNFTDSDPLSGTSYYMLSQIDFDKTVHNSPIVVIKSDSTTLKINDKVYVYPNPAKNEVWISTENKTVDMEEAQVYNSFGYNILNINLENNLQSVNVSNYPKGIYIFIIGKKLFKIEKE